MGPRSSAHERRPRGLSECNDSVRRLVAALLAALSVWLPDSFGEELTSYETDLKAFFEEIDATYPFFDLKGIRKDWEETKTRLTEKVERIQSDSVFLDLVQEAIRSLRDSHVYITNAKAELTPPASKYCPAVGFMPATEGRVIAVWVSETYANQLRPGTVVTKIDGQDARRCLEDRAQEAWNQGGVSSPQRARLFEYRIPLRGEKSETHTLSYLSDGVEKELTVACDMEARGWPHTYNMPANLARHGSSFFFAKLPSGVGYMYLRRVDASVEPGMAKALETHPDAKGWIVDLCGNGGGGYDQALIERIKSLPRPVAVLIDAGCMSAGETLARDLKALAEARVFGSRTAGASSAKREWSFPSGIASLVLPTRSRFRADGTPIEFNGIEPDEEVEAVPEEVAQGINSAIRRAEEYLRNAPVAPEQPDGSPRVPS